MGNEIFQFVKSRDFLFSSAIGLIVPLTIFLLVWLESSRGSLQGFYFELLYPLFWSIKIFRGNCESCISIKGILIGLALTWAIYTFVAYLFLRAFANLTAIGNFRKK